MKFLFLVSTLLLITTACDNEGVPEKQARSSSRPDCLEKPYLKECAPPPKLQNSKNSEMKEDRLKEGEPVASNSDMPYDPKAPNGSEANPYRAGTTLSETDEAFAMELQKELIAGGLWLGSENVNGPSKKALDMGWGSVQVKQAHDICYSLKANNWSQEELVEAIVEQQTHDLTTKDVREKFQKTIKESMDINVRLAVKYYCPEFK
jgi:hypothetical protein